MRLTQVGVIALTFSFGCVRFGYDPPQVPADAAPEDVPDAGDDAAVVSDAAVDGGPIELCPERADALFCDDFEDPKLPRWSYKVVSNGTATRTTSRSRSPSGSLRATTGEAAPNTAARYAARAFDHQKSGEIWLRSYYYVPRSTVVDPSFSTCVVAEVEPPYFGFSLLILPAQVAIGVFNSRYPGTMAFPRDRWTCVELHVQIDAAAGFFEAYLDGALAVRSPAVDTLPDEGYTTLDVGIHYTDPAQGPVEVFVDDVVAGTTRVGCN